MLIKGSLVPCYILAIQFGGSVPRHVACMLTSPQGVGSKSVACPNKPLGAAAPMHLMRGKQAKKSHCKREKRRNGKISCFSRCDQTLPHLGSLLRTVRMPTTECKCHSGAQMKTPRSLSYKKKLSARSQQGSTMFELVLPPWLEPRRGPPAGAPREPWFSLCENPKFSTHPQWGTSG